MEQLEAVTHSPSATPAAARESQIRTFRLADGGDGRDRRLAHGRFSLADQFFQTLAEDVELGGDRIPLGRARLELRPQLFAVFLQRFEFLPQLSRGLLGFGELLAELIAGGGRGTEIFLKA